MTAFVRPADYLKRTPGFATRLRAKMQERGMTQGSRACPWCGVADALDIICLPDDRPFTMRCTATADCLNYTDRKRAKR